MNRNKELWLLLLICLTLFLFASVVHSAEQYKKFGKVALSKIVDGKYDATIKNLEEYLREHPKDLESMYGLAVAYTQKQDIDKAIVYVKQAVGEGLPFSRFLVGPRDLLKPLTDSAVFKALVQRHGVELLHGPLLGCVTGTGAKFWVRTVNEVPIQVIIGVSGKTGSIIKSDVVKTSQAKDFTACYRSGPEARQPVLLQTTGGRCQADETVVVPNVSRLR